LIDTEDTGAIFSEILNFRPLQIYNAPPGMQNNRPTLSGISGL